MDNTFKVFTSNGNLSAYEPNQVFLNVAPGRFANIGYLTTADSDGDGRGALVTDVTGDLHPDLLVRQAGGGPLRIYANRFPRSNRLVVSLDGVESNRLGVGARVTVEVEGRPIVRQIYPTNNFIVSQASEARFGLGDAEKVERLVVNWPSGLVQEFRSVPINAHIRIREDNPRFRVLHEAKADTLATVSRRTTGR